ncbi:hypothetical protein LTR43_007156 [Exophiala xenobiotica]
MDWKNHKILCSSFNNPKPKTDRPDGFLRRGLFFPGGSEPAQFVWVECWTKTEGTWPVDMFDPNVYFGGRLPERHYFSDHNPVQARDVTRDNFEFGMQFYCLDLTVGEPPNLGLRTMTRGQACAPNLRGPILVLRTQKGRSEDSYTDIDMRDVRNAADGFSWMYRKRTHMTPPFAQDDLLAQRVLVTGCLCPQHLAELGTRARFTQFAFNGYDVIFAAGGSGIANLLGIPLFLRTAETPRSGEDGRHNKEAMLLMRDITSTTVGSIPLGECFRNREFIGEKGFGSSPDLWNGTETGSVWIARADGIPLLAEHIEALCAYIENRVEPQLFESIVGLEAGAAVPQREALLNSITKADFLDFFNTFKAEKAVVNTTWASETPAYILSLLTSIGGVTGYVRTGSVPSIAAGLTVGALYGLGGYRISKRQPYGVELALLASILLAGSSIPRAIKTGKPLPAGLSVLAATGLFVYGKAFMGQ